MKLALWTTYYSMRALQQTAGNGISIYGCPVSPFLFQHDRCILYIYRGDKWREAGRASFVVLFLTAYSEVIRAFSKVIDEHTFYTFLGLFSVMIGAPIGVPLVIIWASWHSVTI